MYGNDYLGDNGAIDFSTPITAATLDYTYDSGPFSIEFFDDSNTPFETFQKGSFQSNYASGSCFERRTADSSSTKVRVGSFWDLKGCIFAASGYRLRPGCAAAP